MSRFSGEYLRRPDAAGARPRSDGPRNAPSNSAAQAFRGVSQEGPSTGAPSTSPGLLVSDTARCLASGNGTSVLEVELLVLEMALRRRSQPPSKPVRFSSCAVGFGWKGRPHPSSGCGISTAKRYIHLWTNASNRAEASTPSTNSGGLPNIRQHILTTPSGDPYLSG